MKRGKNYNAAAAAIDKAKLYDTNEALGLVCELVEVNPGRTYEGPPQHTRCPWSITHM